MAILALKKANFLSPRGVQSQATGVGARRQQELLLCLMTAILGFRGKIGPQSPTKLASPKTLETRARAHP